MALFVQVIAETFLLAAPVFLIAIKRLRIRWLGGYSVNIGSRTNPIF